MGLRIFGKKSGLKLSRFGPPIRNGPEILPNILIIYKITIEKTKFLTLWACRAQKSGSSGLAQFSGPSGSGLGLIFKKA
jgi:hypothetical protein